MNKLNSNIIHNLRNLVYLYSNLRFLENKQDCLTIEYKDPQNRTTKVLLNDLKKYFLNQTLYSINTRPLEHLKLDDEISLYSSYSSFRRIKGITANKKYISFNYAFLTSTERAESALKLLENNNIEQFLTEYPELSEELNLFDNVDNIMILMTHLEFLVDLLSENDD